jgi:ubiquinone/menaquinone biosynthesis C-methylase UbiE
MLFSHFANSLHTKRSHLLADRISEFVPRGSKVLDFGCGTMEVADSVGKQSKSQVSGIDVSTIATGHKDFTPYNGKQIPFADQSFDETYAAFVFHHINDFIPLLKECRRVTKKRLVIVEDVYRNPLEHLLIALADFTNWFIDPSMHIPLNFRSEKQWQLLLAALSPAKVATYPIRTAFPRPTQHRIFVVDFKQ